MATLKQENKQQQQQIGELVCDMANISISDAKEKGTMLASSAYRNREEELIKYKIEVEKKVKHHLRLLHEEAEIFKETGDFDQMTKHIDAFKEYMLLAQNCINKEKEYKEAIEAFEKLLERTSEGEVTDHNEHSEKELEAVKEESEMISSNYEADEEKSELISLTNEVENEKEIENVKLEADSSKDGLRRSERNVKEPFWVKDYAKEVKGKGKKNFQGKKKGKK